MKRKITNRTYRNPFEFGRELGSSELVDREDEVAAVRRTIEERGRLFLIGPRRFGKTSILRAASEAAEADGAVVLRFNAEAYPDLPRLAQAISVEATRRLTGSVEKAGQRVKEFFGSLHPELSYDPLAGTFSMAFGAHQLDSDEAVLAEVLGGVNGLAGVSESHVALIVDEFQQVVESGGVRAESQVRAAVQQHDHLAYVFAGSKTRMLSEMTSDHERPFYRLGERLFVGPVPREDFREFLAMAFGESGRQVEVEAIEAILDLAQDVPYNVQRLAHASWHATPAEGTLTADAVRAELDRLVRRDDPFYTQTWNNLSRNQQVALVAVAAENSELYSRSVLSKYGLAQSSLSVALSGLVDRGILRADEGRGSITYTLEDPFFASWISLFVVIN